MVDIAEDPLWHQAVQMQENPEGDPDAVSSKGAEGLMQTLPTTQKDPGYGVAPVKDNSPEEKARVGHDYLKAMHAQYKDPNLALMAYNWGPGNVNKWIKEGAPLNAVPAETKDYLGKITKNYQKLKGEKTMVAENQEVDPIAAALMSDEKNLPESSNAPTSDTIAQLLSEESVPEAATAENAASKTGEKPGYLEDIAKSTPSAIIRGVGAIPQIPAYAGNFAAQLLGQGVGAVHDAFASQPYSEETKNRLKSTQPFYTGATLGDVATKVGAGLTEGVMGDKLSPQQHENLQNLEKSGLVDNELYNPQTLPGKLVSAGIQGAVAGPAAGAGAVPSAISGIGAQTGAELYPNNPMASAIGGLAGPVGSKIVAGAKGNSIDPRVAELAKTMDKKYGVKIPAYQLSNNPLIQRMGSVLDRFGFTKDRDQIGKFNEAVADSIGAKGENNLAPETMKLARKNNSKGYDDVLSKIGEIDANDLDTRLAPIIDNAKKTLTTNKSSSIDNLNHAVNEILDTVTSNNTIPATAYKKLTNFHSTLEDLAKNPDTAKHARLIENELHDALKRSAAPEDVNTLNELDTKWKNMRTVQNLAAKADASGQISPASLLTSVAKSYKDMAYGGAGDIGELATAGKTFKLTPSSGTFENSVVGKILKSIPEIATGGAGIAHGLGYTNPATLGAALGTYGISRIAGSALSSNWYRNFLINQALKQHASPTNPFMGYAIPTSLTGQHTAQ